ncbi:unnamed protein product [Taenia asiatica]|uniref:CRAL-TRIO domain-containing protein n=1 Tax=Taenia asiatica TaxID=60517 RepID=A0A0R3VW75_TAEAS|nr:unnamed protein product [Taenia asiatica]
MLTSTDDAFLLAFLRHSKYNHMKVQRRLDKFCTFRTSPTDGHPAWFEKPSTNRTNWNKFIDMKCWAPLGFTQDGTLVAVMKCENLDLDAINMAEVQSAFQVWYDVCLVDARVQIGGLCVIVDLTNLRKEDIMRMFDPKVSKIAAKYFQECLPFRIRKLIYYNAPKVFETLFNLYSDWLNEKVKSRMPKTAPMQYTLYDPSKPLSSMYKKRAAKELGENPDQISAHLESFRRWLTSMPHLKCTTDDAFLLAFLRHSKYNHMKAQRRLDKFCTFRTSPTEGYPLWFEEPSTNRANWNKLVDMKCYVPIGFTQDGILVIVMKCVNLNLDVISMADLQNALQVWDDACLVDPRAQIGGICMIVDFTSLHKEDIVRMFDPKLTKIATKYFQECLPFRIKKLIYYNSPKVFETLFNIYSEWLNEKIKSRTMVLGSDLSPAFDAIAGLKELMPESYGGDNKLSIEDICAKQTTTMKSFPDVGANFAISVDESKRPKECRNEFGVYKDPTSDVMGKSGIFVKLNQDEI